MPRRLVAGQRASSSALAARSVGNRRACPWTVSQSSRAHRRYHGGHNLVAHAKHVAEADEADRRRRHSADEALGDQLLEAIDWVHDIDVCLCRGGVEMRVPDLQGGGWCVDVQLADRVVALYVGSVHRRLPIAGDARGRDQSHRGLRERYRESAWSSRLEVSQARHVAQGFGPLLRLEQRPSPLEPLVVRLLFLWSQASLHRVRSSASNTL